MSLQLEFYAGDPAVIGPAFTEIEFDGLRDGTVAHSYADLSLHLSPTDLDILSEQAASLVGNNIPNLLDSLEGSIGGTPGESDASLVAAEWVKGISQVEMHRCAEFTKRWLEAVAAESGDDVVTDCPDAVTAVERLVMLCRDSIARSSRVVFAWYL
jgi:hypothetical protein